MTAKLAHVVRCLFRRDSEIRIDFIGLLPLDGGTRTRVVATLYLHVEGVAGVFTSAKKVRAMRQAKLRADLGDVFGAVRDASALGAITDS